MKPKINQEEYEKIKLLPDYDWNWIAREKTGKILSFTNKPTKTDEVWKYTQTRLWFNYEDSQLFQFIQWEDEKPYEIAELIREYEIKELRLAPSGTVIVDSFDSFDESEETEVKDIEELRSLFKDDKLYVCEYVKHKIHQLDEPEVLPVIPKFVAEWITKHRDTYDLYPALRMLENNTLVWSPIYEWYRMNTREFVNAYLTGACEVEDEQKYFVSSRESIGFWFLTKSNDNEVVIGTNKDYYDRRWEELKLTEQEIKDYDSRYMAFATKVEEVE